MKEKMAAKEDMIPFFRTWAMQGVWGTDAQGNTFSSGITQK